MTSKRLAAQAEKATPDDVLLHTAIAFGAAFQSTQDARDIDVWGAVARHVLHPVGGYDEISHATTDAVSGAIASATQRLKAAAKAERARHRPLPDNQLRAYVLEQLDWLDEAARIDPERFAAALAAMRATINGKPSK